MYPDKINCTCFLMYLWKNCEISLTAELFIFKYRWQNISVSNTPTCVAASLLFDRTTLLPTACVRWDRAAVNLWNTRLYRSSSVASQQSDLNPVDYHIKGSCRSVCIAAGFMTLSSWIHAWSNHQVFIDEAIIQWRPRLRACIRAHGGHFEHRL